ncbi:MAG: glycosyltransferase family 9 protein, partial [Candidatus Poribacteria bacterium]|nr:glycosyltransferase family 9 protein [Candidatus Poribacteria bacterium]
VIRAMRQGFPDAHIACMIDSIRTDLVRANPNLDEVIPYQSSVPRLIYSMAKRSFQLAVVLQPTFRLVLHTFLAGIPYRVGFETNSGGRRLLHLAVPSNTNQHETARYLDVVRVLGIEPESDAPEVFVDKESQAWANEFLRNTKISGDSLLIGLNPGAGTTYRRWAVERFAEVGNSIQVEYNAQLLITGGPREADLPHELAALIHGETTVMTDTTPMQLAAIIQRCNLFISNDTGPMHLSTGVKTTTIALFGASNPVQWAPIWPQHTVIARNSMEEIAVEEVLSVVQECLDAEPL